jgi:hypothetical protein
MRRRALGWAALVWAALLSLTACGGGTPLPDQDLLLRVSFHAEEVVPGRAFPLTVVRSWSKDLEPAPWEDGALAPLVLRLEETTRREDARRVQETRRYRAYAFARGDVLVPAAKFTARPKDGGTERSVRSQRRRLRVVPEIEASKPGPPELPGEPLAEPFRSGPWLWGAGAAVALLALLRWRRRKGTVVAAAPTAPPPVPPDVAARARLEEIAARASTSAAARCVDVVETAEVLRTCVASMYGVHTRERTSEEILAALAGGQGVDARVRAPLAALFQACDLVKFAGHESTPEERDALLAGGIQFVAASAVEAA